MYICIHQFKIYIVYVSPGTDLSPTELPAHTIRKHWYPITGPTVRNSISAIILRGYYYIRGNMFRNHN